MASNYRRLYRTVASIVNNSKWRFSYYRKLTPSRLRKIEIPYDVFSKLRLRKLSEVLPRGSTKKNNQSENTTFGKYTTFKLGSLFVLESGEYHKASDLSQGKIPLVACGDFDNGIIAFVSVPPEHTHHNALTVAYNGRPLTTKFHPYTFTAKDDVAICIPKSPMRLSTLIFIQYLINRERWRFSYYRKCFNEKLRYFEIELPIDDEGQIDEAKIERIMNGASYWHYFAERANEIIESAANETPKLEANPASPIIRKITDF